jgi:hypothetical protein
LRGVPAAYRMVPAMCAHGPVGTVGHTPQVLGETGPRSGRGGTGEAARRRRRQRVQESLLRDMAGAAKSRMDGLGMARITRKQPQRGRFYAQ